MRYLKKFISLLIVLLFTINLFSPYFVKSDNLSSRDASVFQTSQNFSQIQNPRELLQIQIKKISTLPELFYDLKPSPEEKVKKILIYLTKAVNQFDSDTTITNSAFFDCIEKAVRQLEFYQKHSSFKKHYDSTLEGIKLNLIAVTRIVTENLKIVCENNQTIFTQKQKKELLKAIEEFNKGVEFEGKKNNEQAIQFYRKAWEKLNELNIAILKLQDRDNDKCPDFLEEKFGLKTNKLDTDGDNLSDFFEILKLFNFTDGKLIDTDKDGIPDWQEDPDEDKLTNIDEQKYNTDPLLPDTDNDGLDDYFEIFTFKSSPLKFDTDEDGLSDKSEYLLGTDPNNPDCDADGLPDGLEEYKQTFKDDQSGTKVEIVAEGDISPFVEINNLKDEEVFSEIYGIVSTPVDIEVYAPFKEATVFIPIDTSKIPNQDFQNVKMFYLDEDLMTFVPLDEQGVDPVNKVVWAKTNHFTTFVLFYIPTWKAIWEVPINKGEREINQQVNYIDLVFVLDSSGSMSWNDPNGYRKIAAKSFVDALIQGDRAAVVDFDDFGYLLQPLTTDFQAVKNAIDRIDSWGGTNIAEGIRIANQQLISCSSEDRIKVIILLTDGEGYYDNNLTTEAKNNGITIYTIGLGTSVDENLLRDIATQTGGMYFPVSSASQLPQVFKRITEIVTEPIDTDEDGVPDSVEISGARTGLGTIVYSDPSNPDTDGDGILDGLEIGPLVCAANGYYYKATSNPKKWDSDNDGLSDAEEDELGTKINLADTDKDGLTDGNEISMGYSPLHKNYDGDSYPDKQEFEKGLDPYLYDKTWYEHIKDILAGATCGDAGEILVRHGLLAERTLKSFGYLIGQIASGFIPFSDIRDAVASLAKLDFAGVLTNLIGFIPGVGDCADIARTLTKFISFGDECISIVSRFIVHKFDEWQNVFRNSLFLPVFALLCKGQDNFDVAKKVVNGDYDKPLKAVSEFAQHNNFDEIASIIKNSKVKFSITQDIQLENTESVIARANEYLKKNGLRSAHVFAERVAVEAAYEYYTKLGYKCIYKAKHGVKGPDLIFLTNTQPREYLIVEAKGALENSKYPTVGESRLFSNVYNPKIRTKERLAQLSFKWLSTNPKRYLGKVEEGMKELLGEDVGKKEFDEFQKFLESKGKYKAALFYASQNKKIRWDGGFDKYFGIIGDDPSIESFEIVKMILK
ncbi:VWA domain-containing protein [Caldicellulosiruptor sp. DIB 104C]|uniref:VWA domain-containing protein n=1 Tax=Caldicellulosiruptor sp. DIB 104C TaxID=3019889 RepID=UPI0023056471|nr:VWA domain-containing protein [Caldicellulosiruptor sp. DIB 104C]